MGKFTGRKQKINYRPVIIIGAIALTTIFTFTYFTWPEPPEPVRFVSPPRYETSPNVRGQIRVDWATNVETACTVRYRSEGDENYNTMTLRASKTHSVLLPAKGGERIEFHVEARAGRETLRSQTHTIEVTAAPATRMASQ